MALLQQHDQAIRDETARGKTDLLRAWDAAYVAQLEVERGPIEVAEYARLVVASEQGRIKDVLAELSLPLAAKVRIERIWLRKTLEDPAFAKRVTLFVKAARSG